MVTLWPHQVECLAAIRRAWLTGPRTLVVLATGTGKTHIYLSLLDELVRDGARALVIAHRQELIYQPVERAHEMFPELAARMGIVMAGRNDADAQVVVATVQTLSANGRLDRALQAGPFEYVVADEAHHITSATWLALLERLGNPRVLGLTATPIRTDGDGLSRVFQSVAYRFPINAAIDRCILVPFRALGFTLPITLAGIAEGEDGWAVEPLGDLLRAPNVLEVVYETWRERAEDRQTFAFTASVLQAHDTAAYFRECGVSAAAVDGGTPDDERAVTLAAFKRGEIRVLANCLDAETEILTQRGWVGIDGIRENDLSAAVDPQTGTVRWESIQCIWNRPRAVGEDMIYIKNQAFNARVTAGHRMLVRTKGAKVWQFKDAETLPGRRAAYQFQVAGYAEPLAISAPAVPTKYTKVGRRSSLRHSLKKRGIVGAAAERHMDDVAAFKTAVRFKDPVELTLEECRFIGLFLADGYLASAGRGIVIAQSICYEQANREISCLLDSCGFAYAMRLVSKVSNLDGNEHSLYHYRIPAGLAGGVLGRGFFHLLPYLDKGLNELFYGLTREQTLALLWGWWLGDGSKNGRPSTGVTSFCLFGTRKEAFERLQILCTLRGIQATLSNRKDNGLMATCPIYTLYVHDRDYVTTNNRHVPTSGGNPAQLEEEAQDERVWCITNTTGTIITRRGGRVLITGQCQIYTEGVDVPEASCALMICPTKSDLAYVQKLGRILRITPTKRDALVLDFAPLDDRNVIMAGDVLGQPRAVKKATARAERSGIMVAWDINGLGLVSSVDPNELVVKVLNYLRRSNLAWALDGVLATAGLSETMMLALLAPDVVRMARAEEVRETWTERERALYDLVSAYRLYVVRKEDRYWQGQAVGVYPTCDEAMGAAEEIASHAAEPILAARRTAWRSSNVSSPQILYMRRLGIDVPDGCTKGQAAQLISQALCRRAVEGVRHEQEQATWQTIRERLDCI